MNRFQPPENLVIYEIEGEWSHSADLDLGSGFLGYWVEGGYTFFFFDRDAEQAMKDLVARRSELDLRHVHRMKYSQWQDGAGFKPFTVGPLVIVPAWDPPADYPDRRLIQVDPGLAFGFGGHPTTRACLEALVRIFREDPPTDVLDLGTGTGILALAAAELGASAVLAVEYSHLAAETAGRNVALNGQEGRIRTVHGLAEDHCLHPAGLVCSNLHFEVQRGVLEKGGFARRRWLLLSGLFHRQAETMESALLASGYRLMDRVRDERWATLLLRTNE